jgi:hypothetical protein
MTRARFDHADANLLAALRATARWQGDRAEAHDDGQLLLVAGARRYPAGYVNCAARLDPTLAPAAALGRAAAFFAARDRGFSWYLRDPVDGDLVAATAQLATISIMPWMALDEPLPEAPLPGGVTLRFADDDARVLDDAIAIRADAYESIGLPSAITASLFDAQVRPGADARVVVADLDGAPAATALVLVTGGVAGIYWVATMRHMRGRGLAEACTRAVTNAGFSTGARFAALQASALGEPVYARLGFVTRWRCRWVLVTREQARELAR